MASDKKGWISVYRCIQDNWIYDDKPFNHLSAWIDLLLLANHTDNKFPLGKEIVTVPTGSLITSELKLMERWGWSKTKVRNFLCLLQSDGMIVRKTDRKKTTINIVNYSNYQNLQTTEEPKKDQKKTKKEPLKDTNNNEVIMINNDNKRDEKNEKPKKHKHGIFTNVLLTDEELAKLQDKYPSTYEKYIDSLSRYIGSHGNKYKDHYRTILNWISKDNEKAETKTDNGNAPKKDYQDFTHSGTRYADFESLLVSNLR